MARFRGTRVQGSAYADIIYGLATNDLLYGNNGDDKIYGGNGRDKIFGGNGRDRLFGGEGDDTMDGGAGVDTMDGGGGIDTVSYATVSAKGVSVFLYKSFGGVTGESADRIYNVENVVGTRFIDHMMGNDSGNVLDGGGERDILWGLGGNDTLIGGAAGDWLFGGDGDDVLRPGADGNNSILGGDGYDTLDYSDVSGGVTIKWAEDPYSPGNFIVQGTDQIKDERIFQIEYIIGSKGDDKIYDAKANVNGYDGKDDIISHDDGVFLNGGDGDDTIQAFGNNNVLIGGDGLDWMLGGTIEEHESGAVQIFQLQYARGWDNIWYFGAEDSLRVSMAEFGIGGTTGAPNVAFEYNTGGNIGPVPQSALPTFMFVNDESSFVWFDRDGSGTEYSAVAIAYVDGLDVLGAGFNAAFEFVA